MSEILTQEQWGLVQKRIQKIEKEEERMAIKHILFDLDEHFYRWYRTICSFLYAASCKGIFEEKVWKWIQKDSLVRFGRATRRW